MSKASKEVVIHRMAPWSVAKVCGVLYLLLGAIAGAAMAVVFLLSPQGGGDKIWLAVVIPIGYALLGFLFSALGAWLYNVVAGMVGGIRMEIEED